MIAMALVLTAAPMAFAQFKTTACDARSGALGGCLFVPERGRTVTLDYRQWWFMSGLAEKSISITQPVGTGVASLEYSHFGNMDYNEQQVAGAYRIVAAEWLEVGVGARYLYAGTSDAHYEDVMYVGASAIMVTHLGQRTTAILAAATRPWDKQRPFGAHLQMGYRPTQELLTMVEVESEQSVRVRAGMEYCYEENYFVRAGFATNPFVSTFGIGLMFKSIAVDLAVEVHSMLGITPQTTMRLWF